MPWLMRAGKSCRLKCRAALDAVIGEVSEFVQLQRRSYSRRFSFLTAPRPLLLRPESRRVAPPGSARPPPRTGAFATSPAEIRWEMLKHKAPKTTVAAPTRRSGAALGSDWGQSKTARGFPRAVWCIWTDQKPALMVSNSCVMRSRMAGSIGVCDSRMPSIGSTSPAFSSSTEMVAMAASLEWT